MNLLLKISAESNFFEFFLLGGIREICVVNIGHFYLIVDMKSARQKLRFWSRIRFFVRSNYACRISSFLHVKHNTKPDQITRIVYNLHNKI